MPILNNLSGLSSPEFDHIIIGGGTCGLTLAVRLTEDPAIRVLVLEAGSYHGHIPEIDVPGYIGRAMGNPKFDWGFPTVPQKRANNRVVVQPRGKGLGGSSSINYMGVFRPSDIETNALEEIGCEGWNWDNLLRYMKKSETLQAGNRSEEDGWRYAVKPDPSYHGTDGPIKKSIIPTVTEVQGKVFDTLERLGVRRNPDTGTGKNDGSMTPVITVDSTTAKRSYVVPGYLEPNLSRPNLLVLPDTYVTKVILETEMGRERATGVEFVRHGVVSQIEGVRHDVVLAAGSYKTPQLLELSGIGNRNLLEKYDLRTRIHLPGVGENLQDHFAVTTIVEVETNDETEDDLRDPAILRKHEELYKQKKGLFSSLSAQAFSFLRSNVLGTQEEMKSWLNKARAQCFESLKNVDPSLRAGLKKQYEIQHRLLDDKSQSQAEILIFGCYYPMPGAPEPKPGKHYIAPVCAISRPLSRGTVHISSTDPLALPSIDPNYFANEADLDLTVRVIKFALKVYASEPLKSHVKEVLMPPKEVREGGEEGFREYVREHYREVYHPLGTAAMMLREDGGVVDPSLRVHGTVNLRVVDLSVLPMALSCHTQSLAYAIGEKAADILKSEFARTGAKHESLSPLFGEKSTTSCL